MLNRYVSCTYVCLSVIIEIYQYFKYQTINGMRVFDFLIAE